MSAVVPMPNQRPLSDIMSEEVRSVMGRRRVNQTALANVLGITQAGVSARLRGATAWKLDELELLADFFGVPATAFLRIGGTSPRPDRRGPAGASAHSEGLEPPTFWSGVNGKLIPGPWNLEAVAA